MPHDPNWFYSTLAQSTAAIVGLAGGFLAARLTTHRAEIASARERLKNDFDNALIGIELLRAKVEVGSVRERIHAFLKEVDAGNAVAEGLPLPLTDRLPTLSQRVRTAPGTAPLTEGQRDQLGQFADTVDRLYHVLEAITPKQLADLLWQGRALRAATEPWLDEPAELPNQLPGSFWDELSLEREHAKLWYQQVRASHASLLGRMRVFRARLIPKTFYYLLGDLIVFLIVGTIVPMAYLTARSTSGKTLLLLAFGVCAVIVVVILLVEMLQIRRAGDLSRDSF